ncbi:unnamed protein product [Symbiodinium necroappetens]|uniref:Tyrosine specific protein phosphatases domain-containing protein n=1 Tax=Symbiodinium necroappetens TaxID=1628268 RepID=A0A812WBF1_9DINO|nr:unnamed protein product [Symbiodinium necroappetens]
MQSDGVEANIKTYGKLMEAAAQVGDVHATKKWLEELRASCFTPDVDHYNMMARAHFKAQNFLAGRQWLFEETFRDRLAPDIVSYNELLAALGELGDQNAAADMLLEAQEQRLTPNLLSYNAAIHSCAQCGDAAGARSRLEEIRAAQLAPDATTTCRLHFMEGPPAAQERLERLKGRLAQAFRREWTKEDWRIHNASKGLRYRDSIDQWPLDMVEVYADQKYRFYLGSITSAKKFHEKCKLDLVFTMNADDPLRHDGELSDWSAYFRDKGVQNFRFGGLDTSGLEPGSKKWVQKKEEFLSIWSAVVEALQRHTAVSENREQIQILFHCYLGTHRSTAALVAVLISLSMSTEEAIDHVLKARAGQEYWKDKFWMLEALLEFEAQREALTVASPSK